MRYDFGCLADREDMSIIKFPIVGNRRHKARFQTPISVIREIYSCSQCLHNAQGIPPRPLISDVPSHQLFKLCCDERMSKS